MFIRRFPSGSGRYVSGTKLEVTKDIAECFEHAIGVDAFRLSTTFIALSDPTRRLILERLARGAASVSELAEPFNISQQAVSKHLAYLERAELIEKRQEGRQRLCALRPEAFEDIVVWVRKCREFWDESFDQLELLVKEIKVKEEKKSARRRK